MRPLTLAALALTAGTAQAQTGLYAPWGKFGQQLRAKGFWASPGQTNPLQPSGFPESASQVGILPPAAPGGEDQRDLRILSDSLIKRSGNLITLTGGVHVQYRGYDIWANSLVGDTMTELFTLTGNVQVVGVDAVVGGDRVTVNFKDETYVAEKSRSTLRPGFFSGRIVADAYVGANRSWGSSARLFGEFGSLTTCDLEIPHFEIRSKSLDIRPGKRVVMRGVDLRLFNRSMFQIPYLSIPLEERDDRYLPEVGSSRDEGYYIKTKFGIPLRGEDLLNTNLDYFTKLGLGLGGSYLYDQAKSKGLLRLYGLVGNNKTLTANQQHSGSIGPLTLNVANNYQKATYYNAPENTMFDTRIGLGLKGTRLTLSQNRNDASGFSYQNQVVALSDQRQFNTRTRAQTDLTLTKNLTDSGTNKSKREQLDIRFRGQHDMKIASAMLEYQRSVPIGDNTNFFNSADRTPVLTLSSDARRLLGDQWNNALPFQTELSLGEYFDPGTQQRVTRGNFDFNFNRSDRQESRFGVDLGGRLRQGWYSDDTAQYVVSTNVGARYSFGANQSINARYSFLRGYGYSPLQIDRTGQTNFLSLDVAYKPIRSLSLAAQTGYDFLLEEQQETAWQSLGIRAEWKPTDWLQARGLATYDPYDRAWSNLRFDLAWQAGATYVGAGARFDGIRHRWGAVNLFVDGFQTGRLRTSALLAYNGYVKKFETRQFSFIYNLHCAEAILEIRDDPLGFRPGTTVSFFIRLKAIPFDTPFGVNRRGAPIGLGTGRDGF